jgi:hypothetical protein
MPRTVNNTDADSNASASTSVQLTAFSSDGLTYKSGYESHSSYPLMMQSMPYVDADGTERKRVWVRGAVRKTSKGTDALFQDHDIVSDIPSELRPSHSQTFVCPVYDAGGGSDRRKELHVQVQTSGVFHVWGSDAETLSDSAGSSLTLDGISWTT